MKKLGLLALVMLLGMVLSADAQNFSSKWLFGKAFYSEEDIRSWNENATLKATAEGIGTMKAVNADGSKIETSAMVKNRAMAGPIKPGDSFVFDVPVDALPSGSYISFAATLTAEPDCPVEWVLEWQKGGKWVEGGRYRCHGPAFGSEHTYTSIYETYRIADAITGGSVKMRLRALEGARVDASHKAEAKGCATFAPSTYIGARVKDFGTSAPKDTTKVLCIGNSFTYYHSCPVMLQELAWNEGHYLDMAASLKGGRTMKHHQTLPTTTDLLEVGGYDVVFLQDQSQAAGKVGMNRTKNASLIQDMEDLADMVREKSPDARFIVEWTWAYPAKEKGGFGSLYAFDTYGKKGSRIMAKAVGRANVSPIAEAFRYCREEHPDIMLYHTDGHHQSVYGSYLKSCVNYLILFGEPFGDNPADCGLDKKKTAVLRSIAEMIVL